MPRILNKIGNAQEDIAKLNTNFDRISLDLADRSGSFTVGGSLLGYTIPSGESRAVEVNVLDQRDIYVVNKLPIIPRIDLYLGNDLNINYLYPVGNSLTQANVHGVQVSIIPARTVYNAVTNEKATVFIHIRNADASSHTIYLYVDGYYVPAPDQGIATRSV